MITIKTTDNGAIVKVTGQYDENFERSYVFDEENMEGMEQLLWDLLDPIHLFGKYSKERISITRVHGEKYDCEEKDCKVCKNTDAHEELI